MSLDWGSLDPEAAILKEPLDGPTLILSGNGCRVTVRTIVDEERRNDNTLKRLYRAVSLLTNSCADGFSDEPQDGFTRIYGGDPPLYVRGEDQREVFSTLGRGILKAGSETRDKLNALGVRALVEW